MTTRIKTGILSRVLSLKDPWRFKAGDKAYVRNWPQEYPVRVESRVEPKDLRPLPEAMANAITCRFPIVPHYEVTDHLGGVWLLSQLQLSTNPITKERT